jgi:CHAD domain-containing protein
MSLPTGIAAKSIGLEVWMNRVLEIAQKVQPGWDAGDVHDLRVALRRSRTMAEALSEVNPAPGWRKLKKASAGVFHVLGDLRDIQIERSWIKKLGIPGDVAKKQLLRRLSRQEKKLRQEAEKALDKFDRKEWRRLSRKLPPKAHFFPLESVVFQRLALACLNEAVDLYQQARKRRSAVAWHRLRIGIKRFRYVVENFLPQRYEVWAQELKRMQDLLGEVHDLDVLRGEIRRQAGTLDQAVVARWMAKIGSERKLRLKEFLARTSDKNSPWIVWRAGFQWGRGSMASSFPERRTA